MGRRLAAPAFEDPQVTHVAIHHLWRPARDA
jgi:hypothetical protein